MPRGPGGESVCATPLAHRAALVIAHGGTLFAAAAASGIPPAVAPGYKSFYAVVISSSGRAGTRAQWKVAPRVQFAPIVPFASLASVSCPAGRGRRLPR